MEKFCLFDKLARDPKLTHCKAVRASLSQDTSWPAKIVVMVHGASATKDAKNVLDRAYGSFLLYMESFDQFIRFAGKACFARNAQ